MSRTWDGLQLVSEGSGLVVGHAWRLGPKGVGLAVVLQCLPGFELHCYEAGAGIHSQVECCIHTEAQFTLCCL